MDINMEMLNLNAKQSQIMQGVLVELDGLTFNQVQEKRDLLIDTMQPADKNYQVKCAELALLQNVMIQLSGDDPNDVQSPAFNDVGEEDVMQHAQKLQNDGYPELAEAMKKSFTDSKNTIEDSERREEKLLAGSNKKLNEMRAEQVKNAKKINDAAELQRKSEISRSR